ncbi:MAG: 5-formyltetrahydrofolate cyclo-ligase [Burkholderiales bacterium]|jgi:5,10-methenyltetrahydrofolate synthetase|nr:5-formyltetrahydrofolate cyclo-ligase [Burkholderiales bacterium]
MNEPASMNWKDISAWRKAQREHWIAWRGAVPETQGAAWGEAMTASLCAMLPAPQKCVIGFCWPFKAEFDARYAVRHWRERGAVAALPEVTGKGQPLRFSQWWPGAPMRRGVYDIPVPDGTSVVLPDIAIVPMNACDGRGYRLGYGGGYFDRTLAALEKRVVAIGVTYDACRVASIFPQVHDIAMDFVVTEAGIYSAGGEPLRLLDAVAAVSRVKDLMRLRGLPRELS